MLLKFCLMKKINRQKRLVVFGAEKTKKFLNKGAIGIFDSGFGGINILKSIQKRLPNYEYIYLGDNARAPYGNRSQKIIYTFTKQSVDFLFKKNCQLIILACNTASSQALRKIQQEYLPKHYPKRRILGVIIPASEKTIEITKNNKVGVIGTKATISSDAFEREIKKLNPKIKVFEKSCPILVKMIELGETNTKIIDRVLKKYLDPLIKKHIDTLVLGCTHYEFLENEIKKIVGKNIKIVSEGKIIAEKLKNYLERHSEIKTKLNKNSKITFLTTGSPEKFKILVNRFYKNEQKISPVKIILKKI